MTLKKFLALLGMVAVLGVALSTGAAQAQNRENTSETYRLLNLFGNVFERVRAEYVEDVPDEELIENAISGMLTMLDPHSSYLNAKDYGDIKVNTKGEFGGLGIEVTMENGLVKVVAPIDDTPAFHAGVEAGDLIFQLDDEPVLGLTLNEAVDRMRGKVGEPLIIHVRREGEEKPLKFEIVRDRIKIRSVRHRVEDDIGYIRITTFNEQTQTGLEKAFDAIKDEIDGELLGYVLDMRNNPGGLLNEAITVSDSFLEQGEIVSIRGRREDQAQRFNAKAGDLAEGKPVVVLINGGSASGSEIVAGALQDHRRAVVLGTDSFGKGSVQTVIPLSSSKAIRLTTALYYTPSGRSIQAEGIVPDIYVPLARVEEVDFRARKESDLRGAISNPDEDDAEDRENTDEDDGEPQTTFKDYQLERALDLLRGLALFNEKIQ